MPGDPTTIIVSRELPEGPVEAGLVIRPMSAMLGVRAGQAVCLCKLSEAERHWFNAEVLSRVQERKA